MKNQLIPLLQAYTNCVYANYTTKLHDAVLAKTIETVELQGKIFVNSSDAEAYYPEDSIIKKPSKEELEKWVAEVKANSQIFNPNNL